ncbi:NVEALA domain-containing protein [Parabacteroides bouchesdurhonensis]|uniref:NVEALA domain-containing protein n=1 Tax=Parabacteroides bouchesdurhonensis TaxID=1936995 RepID=UPI000E4A92A3|nr:NVEALA domain-containing protein [Parabacteroides bouchesdurhonensis]RHJ93007.1 hypothetical protein DW095_06535 [Bacteroides sp. AM07-16]
MKKIRFKSAIILAVCFLGYLLFTETNKKDEVKINKLKELVSSNTEALAESESGGGRTVCMGNGSIDCFGNRVAYMYSGFNLDDF